MSQETIDPVGRVHRRASWLARTLLLVPRNLVIGFLLLYRLVISPSYGDVCKYHPSCSAYGLGAVQRFGVLRGGWLTVRRLFRCHPWARGGIDDVPQARPSRDRLLGPGFVVTVF